MSKPSPLKVFITYSHRNRAEKDELITCLATMERKGAIEIWHDSEMLASDKWNETIYKKPRRIGHFTISGIKIQPCL